MRVERNTALDTETISWHHWGNT